MRNSLLMSLILLPGTVTIFIPFVLVSLSSFLFGPMTHLSNYVLVLISSSILIYIGLFLLGTTILLFIRIGQGTPAPWDPPKYLVVRGPYRYVRNPMILGVLLILLGEALMFWSVVLLAWTAVFLAANLVYFPLVEEKQLRRRFGAEYDEYAEQVPRWIPRLTPWNKT
jgi:protein-S-isoprenylcysteine O-methyltransferase Ste14